MQDALCILINTKKMRTKKSGWSDGRNEDGRAEEGRHLCISSGSACGAGGPRYLWRQLNSREHMILAGRASRRGHVGGRAIRRDRAQADVPCSRPLISPCSLYILYAGRSPHTVVYERRVLVSVVPALFLNSQ